jgi:DNA-binding transcriptional MocR family regulator
MRQFRDVGMATVHATRYSQSAFINRSRVMYDWTPDLSISDRPRYLALADRIAADIQSGKLVTGDRLPPQRKLAERLGVDFTTVARGYVEAQKRGLIESRQGQGTFVQAGPKARAAPAPASRPRPDAVDLSMNLPPEPDDPQLIERMQAGLEMVGRDLVSLMRYQGFGGGPLDKEAASLWLSRRGLVPAQERIFITPGAHPALLGILSILAKPGQVVLSEGITYPGIRSIAAQLNLSLVGLPMDDEGIDPDAFSAACSKLSPKALYLNPTLQNPTTLTMSQKRRETIAAIARRWSVPIVEDDAYGFIPSHAPGPLASVAPDITWYVAGLAKCIGAGMRVAYVVAPDARSGWAFAAAVRSATVMASPLTVALATRWIEDGTADSLLRFIRMEAAARQAIARQALPPGSFRGDPVSFNIWVPLPEGWTRSAFIGHMRATGIGVVASDPFTVTGNPPEAVRICLGGPASRAAVQRALDFAAHALEELPAMATSFL